MVTISARFLLLTALLFSVQVYAQSSPSECEQRIAKHDQIDAYFQEDEYDRTWAKSELDLMLNTQDKLDNYANGLAGAMAALTSAANVAEPGTGTAMRWSVGGYIAFIKGRNLDYRIKLNRYKLLIDQQGNKNKETRQKNANNRNRAIATNCGSNRPGPGNGGLGGSVPDTGGTSDPLDGIGDAEPVPDVTTGSGSVESVCDSGHYDDKGNCVPDD